ncbi:MAG: double zinc ribbon domain-containing protein [Thermoplasmatota archaeon]
MSSGTRAADEPHGDNPVVNAEMISMALVEYMRSIRWGQVLFGAAFALVAWDFVSRALARDWGLGTALLGFGLVLLLLAFGIYLGNQFRFGIVPDYSLRCRYCNGPVNRYSEFCEHCGADLIEESKLIRCPGCDAEVYLGTPHCPECGRRLPDLEVDQTGA